MLCHVNKKHRVSAFWEIYPKRVINGGFTIIGLKNGYGVADKPLTKPTADETRTTTRPPWPQTPLWWYHTTPTIPVVYIGEFADHCHGGKGCGQALRGEYSRLAHGYLLCGYRISRRQSRRQHLPGPHSPHFCSRQPRPDRVVHFLLLPYNPTIGSGICCPRCLVCRALD